MPPLRTYLTRAGRSVSIRSINIFDEIHKELPEHNQSQKENTVKGAQTRKQRKRGRKVREVSGQSTKKGSSTKVTETSQDLSHALFCDEDEHPVKSKKKRHQKRRLSKDKKNLYSVTNQQERSSPTSQELCTEEASLDYIIEETEDGNSSHKASSALLEFEKRPFDLIEMSSRSRCLEIVAEVVDVLSEHQHEASVDYNRDVNDSLTDSSIEIPRDAQHISCHRNLTSSPLVPLELSDDSTISNAEVGDKRSRYSMTLTTTPPRCTGSPLLLEVGSSGASQSAEQQSHATSEYTYTFVSTYTEGTETGVNTTGNSSPPVKMRLFPNLNSTTYKGKEGIGVIEFPDSISPVLECDSEATWKHYKIEPAKSERKLKKEMTKQGVVESAPRCSTVLFQSENSYCNPPLGSKTLTAIASSIDTPKSPRTAVSTTKSNSPVKIKKSPILNSTTFKGKNCIGIMGFPNSISPILASKYGKDNQQYEPDQLTSGPSYNKTTLDDPFNQSRNRSCGAVKPMDQLGDRTSSQFGSGRHSDKVSVRISAGQIYAGSHVKQKGDKIAVGKFVTRRSAKQVSDKIAAGQFVTRRPSKQVSDKFSGQVYSKGRADQFSDKRTDQICSESDAEQVSNRRTADEISCGHQADHVTDRATGQTIRRRQVDQVHERRTAGHTISRNADQVRDRTVGQVSGSNAELVSDRTAGQVISGIHTDQVSDRRTAGQVISGNHTDQVSDRRTAGQVISGNHTDQVSDRTAGQVISGNHTDQVSDGRTAGQVISGSHTDQASDKRTSWLAGSTGSREEVDYDKPAEIRTRLDPNSCWKLVHQPSSSDVEICCHQDVNQRSQSSCELTRIPTSSDGIKKMGRKKAESPTRQTKAKMGRKKAERPTRQTKAKMGRKKAESPTRQTKAKMRRKKAERPTRQTKAKMGRKKAERPTRQTKAGQGNILGEMMGVEECFRINAPKLGLAVEEGIQKSASIQPMSSLQTSPGYIVQNIDEREHVSESNQDADRGSCDSVNSKDSSNCGKISASRQDLPEENSCDEYFEDYQLPLHVKKSCNRQQDRFEKMPSKPKPSAYLEDKFVYDYIQDSARKKTRQQKTLNICFINRLCMASEAALRNRLGQDKHW